MIDLVALSNYFYVIVSAYIAAFLPWSTFNTQDSISDNWKTICSTRTACYINLQFSFIPAMYILFYAATQFKGEDPREGCTAIIALLFALLHGARSAWGLWQLHVFRTWCAKSIDALGAMGVPFRFSNEERRERVQRREMTQWEMADQMLANNTMVDNQITHGDTVSHIKFGNTHVRPPTSPQSWTWLGTVIFVWNYVKMCAWTLTTTTVMLADNLRFFVGAGTIGKVRQVPKSPVEVWINWSIVFAAQGLEDWMSEFCISKNPAAGEEQDEVRKHQGLEGW